MIAQLGFFHCDREVKARHSDLRRQILSLGDLYSTKVPSADAGRSLSGVRRYTFISHDINQLKRLASAPSGLIRPKHLRGDSPCRRGLQPAYSVAMGQGAEKLPPPEAVAERH